MLIIHSAAAGRLPRAKHQESGSELDVPGCGLQGRSRRNHSSSKLNIRWRCPDPYQVSQPYILYYCGKLGDRQIMASRRVRIPPLRQARHLHCRCVNRRSSDRRALLASRPKERRSSRFNARQHRNDKLEDRDTIHNERTPNKEVKVMTEPNKRWAPGGGSSL